jgi:HlyD family secretion protein
MKRRGWIIGGSVALGLVLAAAAFGVVVLVRGPSVVVTVVQQRPLVQTVVVSGRVAAAARVAIGTVAMGRVVEVAVREGDRVKAGAVLVRLEDREAGAALAQAGAALQQALARSDQVRGITGRVASEDQRQAKAALDLAELRFTRTSSLAAAGASTGDELDQARMLVEQARARHAAARSQAAGSGTAAGAESRAAIAAVDMARANVESASARLAQTRILAPADGTILARNVEPGDVVLPGAALLGLATDGASYLVVQPDEKNLNLLREGQDAVASADAFPGRTFPARVARILPAVDRLRGTVEVHLSLPAPPDFLRPDMTVSVEVVAERRESALVLPETAVHEVAGARPWVLAVRDGRLERRDVRLGLRGEDRVEVVEGVVVGEDVVSGDGLRLKAGQRVRAVRE